MQNSAESRKKPHDGSEGSLPRGTVTFLFTDIEGSTRLLARLRDGYAEVLDAHHRALRAALEAHDGVEVHTEGDAFFVAFARASDAIAAAVAAQRALAAHPWPQGVDVRVRMGLHTGEAEVRDDDYVGMDVHRAARICSAAHGGQVLVSSATRELVVAELDAGVALDDLGEHRLKDLERPEQLYQVVADELAAEFPPLRSEAAGNGASRLPPAPNQTIGRDADVRAIAGRIRSDEVRLLTLTGPGGVGKTRLAVEAARAMEADYADGARFVSLATLKRHEDVAQAIVTALGIVVLSGESSEQAVTRFLAAKHLLLVVDNLEHVLGAAPFIGGLIGACPTLTAVATSREPLALQAEVRYPVGALGSGDAVALFGERATAHDPGFLPDTTTADHVAEICRRVDGLPLAIELAAARCALLSPAEIAQRLDAALGASGAGPRDAPERQRTLRATIDWSHDLLDEDERTCFARFAVFAGGATVDAAEAIMGADLDTLDRLVAKSLLVRRASPDAPTRLLMLETVRSYAGERFGELPDAEDVRERHYEHFLGVAERHGTDRALWGADGGAQAAALDAESDNLIADLAWAVDRQDAERALRLVTALGLYWRSRSRFAEAVDWVDRALALPGADGHPVLSARAMCVKGRSLWPLGRTAEQTVVIEETVAAARRVGDELVLAEALGMSSDRACMIGQLDVAEAYADESLEHATRAGDAWAVATAWFSKAMAATTIADLRERADRAVSLLADAGNAHDLTDLLSSAAYAAMCMGRDEDAKAFVERALTASRRFGRFYGRMLLEGNRGLVALFTGDIPTARDAFHEELRLSRELVVQPSAHEGLMGLAAVAAVDGDHDRAARLRGASEGLRNDFVDEVQERLATQFFEPARKRHGADAWDAAEHEGRALSFAVAVAYGLEEERPA
jgi:predicted ATPase/class 3 adenylate cyclase